MNETRDLGHQVAAVAPFCCLKGKWRWDMRSGLPAGREEDASEASQDGPLEKMCSQSTSVRVEREILAGADPSFVAKRNQ